MWSDPIADMLTRIRNAARNRARHVSIPFSAFKAEICRVLRDEGYILGFDRIDDSRQGVLRVELKYGPRGEQVLQSIRRESKAGRRLYRGYGELPTVLNGLGISVVSTSRGVMSDRQCRQQKLGGELICTVY
ncbi:MAG: 30S ribosomal protein S8 [Phycisphaerae bacterium]|nr:30S ribosomal protein S8 [Phycisphaerae bacterium]